MLSHKLDFSSCDIFTVTQNNSLWYSVLKYTHASLYANTKNLKPYLLIAIFKVVVVIQQTLQKIN